MAAPYPCKWVSLDSRSCRQHGKASSFPDGMVPGKAKWAAGAMGRILPDDSRTGTGLAPYPGSVSSQSGDCEHSRWLLGAASDRIYYHPMQYTSYYVIPSEAERLEVAWWISASKVASLRLSGLTWVWQLKAALPDTTCPKSEQRGQQKGNFLPPMPVSNWEGKWFHSFLAGFSSYFIGWNWSHDCLYHQSLAEGSLIHSLLLGTLPSRNNGSSVSRKECRRAVAWASNRSATVGSWPLPHGMFWTQKVKGPCFLRSSSCNLRDAVLGSRGLVGSRNPARLLFHPVEGEWLHRKEWDVLGKNGPDICYTACISKTETQTSSGILRTFLWQ